MELDTFRQKMKKMGKKPHVVQGLINSVEQFAHYLENNNKSINQAQVEDVEAFAQLLEGQKKGTATKVIRGIALYFEMINRPEIAHCAKAIRERAIARTRRVFQLKEFLDVDEKYMGILAEHGIVNVQQMIKAGKTPKSRKALAAKTGIPLAIILEYVKLSDLTRIGALRRVRARLYYNAGLDTIDKIATSDPIMLRKHFIKYVEETGFDGIAPLPKEIRNAVKTAQNLERLVDYS